NKRQTYQRNAKYSGSQVSQIDSKLSGHRTGGQLGERKTFEIILATHPTTPLDQFALHITHERYRSAETRGAEAEEVTTKPRQRDRNRRFFHRLGYWHDVSSLTSSSSFCPMLRLARVPVSLRRRSPRSA